MRTRVANMMGARGAALLEVVLSVGVLVTAMTYIGAQLQQGLTSASMSRDRIEALMLAETVLAEVDMGQMAVELDEELDVSDEGLTGDFGASYPGYAWSVTIDKTAVEGLNLVAVSILKGRPKDLSDEEAMSTGDEGDDESGDDDDEAEEAELEEYEDFQEVYTCWTYRVEKLPMTLTDVVGEEKATTMSDLLPPELTEQLEALGIDPTNLDVKSLMTQLDMDQLLELMPMLNQALGGALGGSMWDQLQQAIMKYQSQRSSSGGGSGETEGGEEGDESDDGGDESDDGQGDETSGDEDGGAVSSDDGTPSEQDLIDLAEKARGSR